MGQNRSFTRVYGYRSNPIRKIFFLYIKRARGWGGAVVVFLYIVARTHAPTIYRVQLFPKFILSE
nr:MAG TPA: hypothetical protein [Caudoviricetes sp.]